MTLHGLLCAVADPWRRHVGVAAMAQASAPETGSGSAAPTTAVGAPPSGSAWEFEVTPYVWFSGLSGDFGDRVPIPTSASTNPSATGDEPVVAGVSIAMAAKCSDWAMGFREFTKTWAKISDGPEGTQVPPAGGDGGAVGDHQVTAERRILAARRPPRLIGLILTPAGCALA
jgi:hypothetical protein